MSRGVSLEAVPRFQWAMIIYFLGSQGEWDLGRIELQKTEGWDIMGQQNCKRNGKWESAMIFHWVI